MAEHWDHVDEMLDQYAAFVAERQQAGRSRDEILADMRAWDAGQQASAGLDEIAHERYRSVGPTDMSVDGILRYWAKRPPAEGRA